MMMHGMVVLHKIVLHLAVRMVHLDGLFPGVNEVNAFEGGEPR